MMLLDKADPKRKTLKRTRQCFVWKSQYFALDTFTNVKNGITILRMETESSPDMPEFLQVARDVTHEQGYSSYVLSKLQYYVSDQDKTVIPE
mmetsp:Transcript_21604/g.39509  ORF Transcript_21604/g.39509 Transcript_21604/m.39509 type:complete len:92 (+) Transcript_21604:1137-1412(+)